MENTAPSEQQPENDSIPPTEPPVKEPTPEATEEESAPGIQVDPQSEWDALREYLKKEPQDVDSWLKLVDMAEESGNYDRTKETYELLVEHFPNTVS